MAVKRGILLFLLFFTAIYCQQDAIEGFFTQSGHTNNWAVLVSSEYIMYSFIYTFLIGLHFSILVQLSTCCQHTFYISNC